MTRTSSWANFERILYAETCQPHTISSKNIEASSSMRGSSFRCQAAQIWSINLAKYVMVKPQKWCFEVALKKYCWWGSVDFFGWGQSSLSLYSIENLMSMLGMRYHPVRRPQTSLSSWSQLKLLVKFHEISNCWMKLNEVLVLIIIYIVGDSLDLWFQFLYSRFLKSLWFCQCPTRNRCAQSRIEQDRRFVR